MTWQELFTVAAASSGFASAMWFAAGSVLMKARQIEKSLIRLGNPLGTALSP